MLIILNGTTKRARWFSKNVKYRVFFCFFDGVRRIGEKIGVLGRIGGVRLDRFCARRRLCGDFLFSCFRKRKTGDNVSGEASERSASPTTAGVDCAETRRKTRIAVIIVKTCRFFGDLVKITRFGGFSKRGFGRQYGQNSEARKFARSSLILTSATFRCERWPTSARFRKAKKRKSPRRFSRG